MTDSPLATGAATLKDVYELVDSTRKETNDNINTLGAKFDEFVTSNEHRLTVVEQHQAATAEQLATVTSRLDDHGREIGTLKDKQRTDEAATRALTNAKTKRLSTRERVGALIGTAIIAVMAVITAITAIH